MDVKVEIYRNKFIVYANGVSKILVPKSPFSTSRLLVGNFNEAEECLRKGFKEMRIRTFPRFFKPKVHLHPKEMSEGGLCGVEQRVLYEIAYSAGAKSVEIHE